MQLDLTDKKQRLRCGLSTNGLVLVCSADTESEQIQLIQEMNRLLVCMYKYLCMFSTLHKPQDAANW